MSGVEGGVGAVEGGGEPVGDVGGGGAVVGDGGAHHDDASLVLVHHGGVQDVAVDGGGTGRGGGLVEAESAVGQAGRVQERDAIRRAVLT